MSSRRVILLRHESPPKPPEGAACNGCGMCCTAAPCPLGMLISRRTSGPCAALMWNEEDGRYRCGAVLEPERVLPWLPQRWARALALRWIASGDGCDAGFEVVQGLGASPVS